MNRTLRASTATAILIMLSAGTGQTKDLTFGYIPNSMSFPFNVKLTDGFCAKAAEKGVKCVILDSKMSMERQANQFDDLIGQGVDAIGLMADDSVAVQVLIDKASQAGIPVAASSVFVGDPTAHEPNWVYPNLTALVMTDDTEAGVIAAKYVAEHVDKSKEVIIGVLEGAPGFATNELRQKGFEDTLKAEGVKYNIVASQATDWTPESGDRICQNMLTAHPDISVVFSHADQMNMGCSRALAGMGKHALLVDASGGSTLAANAVKAGELDMTACNQPGLIGELTFAALYEAVTAGKAAKKGQYIAYPMVAVSKENPDACPAW
ncbi:MULTISPECIES: sugar ABC transporter substrate-binding protein [unclassified Mesorhizobium]|uniref:sugar ABC transporter substrate-binding protein n=1 Tax=unclassified Mesorhizobium TaxID=325217 RepID=UPI000FD901D6|nr:MULTISPECIES: sugar ABC transporter substrate-binding protein [unclassified Mesorhizobium]TGR18793.1 sugar ABC transporter substrate-binding protein [Mesorhizobium sp. M8A.F.Ca.ET.197.01.1.1]TGR37057.1 sugar ABC transporter substrate-binding protein [bacterium M00.F.Ca.ET.199.01.1.1]TGR41605.1 sugar ABC transporter substrate-binding protein [Mesorhizobium sp. M8A.F.Ca.ET.198.01.1.1]TGV85316.1 sugar ABC transporter substrate-binding protein [Mesorhizobium sp. M00.F.Ca.ET.149.01.1.1]